MRARRFGRKIKLPATIAIKHQIRMLMAKDEAKKAEAQLIEQSARRVRDGTFSRSPPVAVPSLPLIASI
jgi:hypothetical protein